MPESLVGFSRFCAPPFCGVRIAGLLSSVLSLVCFGRFGSVCREFEHDEIVAQQRTPANAGSEFVLHTSATGPAWLRCSLDRYEHPMKEMEVGMKIGMKEGPSFFGLEQVNAALKSGASVISVREGALITSKVGEGADDVEMAVTGFSVKIVLDESASKRSVRPWWRFWE